MDLDEVLTGIRGVRAHHPAAGEETCSSCLKKLEEVAARWDDAIAFARRWLALDDLQEPDRRCSRSSRHNDKPAA